MTTLAGRHERGLTPEQLRAWDLVPDTLAYVQAELSCSLTDAMLDIFTVIEDFPWLQRNVVRHMYRYPWLSRYIGWLIDLNLLAQPRKS